MSSRWKTVHLKREAISDSCASMDETEGHTAEWGGGGGGGEPVTKKAETA